jgi:DNA-binding NarL/FixJ family response regulator
MEGRALVGEKVEVRILLADDDARVCSALQTLLAQETDKMVVRECSDIGCLAAEIKAFEPDVVLLDWELPGHPASALLFAFHELASKPKVMILSARPEAERAALAAGADAFVCKGEPPEHLLSVFRELVQGLASNVKAGQNDGSGVYC